MREITLEVLMETARSAIKTTETVVEPNGDFVPTITLYNGENVYIEHPLVTDRNRDSIFGEFIPYVIKETRATMVTMSNGVWIIGTGHPRREGVSLAGFDSDPDRPEARFQRAVVERRAALNMHPILRAFEQQSIVHPPWPQYLMDGIITGTILRALVMVDA